MIRKIVDFIKKCHTEKGDMNISADNCKNIVGLSNIEIYEFCLLNIETGEKSFTKDEKQIPEFLGFYFSEGFTFFALYATKNGSMMYYEGKEYPLKKELHIRLTKMGKIREFCIEEYGICIQYHTSPYIGFDVWSEEKDVDLFYQIEQSYQDDAYYEWIRSFYIRQI